jgi:hypothetical protein
VLALVVPMAVISLVCGPLVHESTHTADSFARKGDMVLHEQRLIFVACVVVAQHVVLVWNVKFPRWFFFALADLPL